MSLPRCLSNIDLSNVNLSVGHIFCAPFYNVKDALSMLPLVRLQHPTICLKPDDITESLINDSKCSQIQDITNIYCGLCPYYEDNIIHRQQSEIEVLKYYYHHPSDTSLQLTDELFRFYTIKNGEMIFTHLNIFKKIKNQEDLSDYGYLKGQPKDNKSILETIDTLLSCNKKFISTSLTNINELIDSKISALSNGNLYAYKRGPVKITCESEGFTLTTPKFQSKRSKGDLEYVFSNASIIKFYNSDDLERSGILFQKNIYNKLIDTQASIPFEEFEKSPSSDKEKHFIESQCKFVLKFHPPQNKTPNIIVSYENTPDSDFIMNLVKSLVKKRVFHQYPLWFSGTNEKQVSFFLDSGDKDRMLRGAKTKLIYTLREVSRNTHFKKFKVTLNTKKEP